MREMASLYVVGLKDYEPTARTGVVRIYLSLIGAASTRGPGRGFQEDDDGERGGRTTSLRAKGLCYTCVCVGAKSKAPPTNSPPPDRGV